MPKELEVSDVTAAGVHEGKARLVCTALNGERIDLLMPTANLASLGYLLIHLQAVADEKAGDDSVSGFAPDAVEMDGYEDGDTVVRFANADRAIAFLLDPGLLAELEVLARRRLETIRKGQG